MLNWVAGRGELGGSLDDPSNGDFNHPTNIIFDESGDNILIAAWHNSKVRRVERATGMIVDTCGDGKRAYFGDDGPAGASSLDLPASLALDPAGNLIIMDQANQVLRFIDKAGDIHLLRREVRRRRGRRPPGPVRAPRASSRRSAPTAPTAPRASSPAATRPCSARSRARRVTPATTSRPSRCAWPSPSGSRPPRRKHRVRQGRQPVLRRHLEPPDPHDRQGRHRAPVAGTPPEDGVPQNGYAGDGGPAIAAKLNFPVDLAFADDGTLYFTDVRNHCVRSIDTAGNIHTAVGRCGEKGYEGDGGPRRRGAPQPALRGRVGRRHPARRRHRQQRDPPGASNCDESAPTTSTSRDPRARPRRLPWRRPDDDDAGPEPLFPADYAAELRRGPQLPRQRRPRPQQHPHPREPQRARPLPGVASSPSPSTRWCSRRSTTSAT
jgi:hypothetical protein